MKKLSTSHGFTLIELLVVITIIGLLASTVLASLSGARIAARDIKRVSEAKELAKALEIFRNTNGGDYPCNANNTAAGRACSALATSLFNDRTLANNDSVLMAAIKYTPTPEDSRAATIQYRVATAANRASYSIRVYQESLSGYCLGSVVGTGVAAWVAYPACGQ